MDGVLTEFWKKGGLTTLSVVQLAAASAISKCCQWISQSATKYKRCDKVTMVYILQQTTDQLIFLPTLGNLTV